MQLFNRYVSTRSLTVFAGELFLIFGSVALAAGFQSNGDVSGSLWKIGLVTVEEAALGEGEEGVVVVAEHAAHRLGGPFRELGQREVVGTGAPAGGDVLDRGRTVHLGSLQRADDPLDLVERLRDEPALVGGEDQLGRDELVQQVLDDAPFLPERVGEPLEAVLDVHHRSRRPGRRALKSQCCRGAAGTSPRSRGPLRSPDAPRGHARAAVRARLR